VAARNPFSPTFGTSPPVLVGRDEILEDVDDAFETGPTHPDYTVLFVGVRGTGKTAMLNATEDLARKRGWLTVSENASPAGLLARLTQAVQTQLAELETPEPSKRVTGVSGAGFGMTFDHADQPQSAPALRTVLAEVGKRLEDTGTGLVITIDELQSGDIDELREFGAVLQHVTRRELLPIAFAGASLPSIVDTLLSDDEIATFLQRCSRYDIDRIKPEDASEAIVKPIRNRGGGIAEDDLARAVTAAAGYAFMIQLVGFHIWKAASNPADGISADETSTGIAEAEQRIGRLIFAPTWQGLSDVDRRFLLAMARDDDESRLAIVADRLEVDTNYAGVYRHRLIRSGMIRSAGHGKVDFAHHSTRTWLRNEAAYAAISFPDDDPA